VSTCILRVNATPVYRFLSLIHAALPTGETLEGKPILDCGAGGAVPPLCVFASQGMKAHGIDTDPKQLERARAFCEERDIKIDLRQADMRAIPFADHAFDYVYEQYAMCHLSLDDTSTAVAEMRRVLRPGGMALFGVISADSWPLSAFGVEGRPGEYRMVENGEDVCHSVFTDEQSDRLAMGWEILRKEKVTLFARGRAEAMSRERWRALREKAPAACSERAWEAEYADRHNWVTYVHTYYYVRKPRI